MEEMTGFDDLWIWDDPAMGAAMGWYHAVAADRMPAKFRIAATVPLALDPDTAEEAALWAELDRLTPLFGRRLGHIREGAEELGPVPPGATLLDLCRALTARMLAHCNFCAWDCGVDRTEGGKLGACKLAADTRVSSYFHHLGEELVYRGRRGSGTIFFSSCNMRCAFCQNGDISTDKDNGMVTDARTLATMAWLLRREGCHNINWVGGEATVHLHTIVAAIALLGGGFGLPADEDLRRALLVKADPLSPGALDSRTGTYGGGFNVPMLWNSNFFMSKPAMKILRILMDAWLPDFKFGPGRCAITLARTPRYWETVTANLGLLGEWGEDATVRHLVMPNHVECCTYPVLDWLVEHLPETPVNIMDQYHPDMFCDPRSALYDPRYAELARRPRADEIRDAYGYARRRGLPFEAVTRERNRMGLGV